MYMFNRIDFNWNAAYKRIVFIGKGANRAAENVAKQMGWTRLKKYRQGKKRTRFQNVRGE